MCMTWYAIAFNAIASVTTINVPIRISSRDDCGFEIRLKLCLTVKNSILPHWIIVVSQYLMVKLECLLVS